MSHKPKPAGPLPPADRRRRILYLALFLGGAGLLVGLVLWPFWRLSGQFDDLTFLQPSRLYASPLRVYEGLALTPDRLVRELAADGYREHEAPGPVSAGSYRAAKGGVAVHLRRFTTPEGQPGGGLLEVSFRGRRVAQVARDGATVEAAWLEPALVHTYYGPDLKERRPVTVDEVPEDLVEAVLAAEDAGFFRHSGLSPTGILRALWSNLRKEELQGGSTLTQQLVKNLYLTHERSMKRKAPEAVLAVLLELRYGKREILEAYLNEIYLGQAGGVNLMGVGAAARAFFGKDVSQLELDEAATLAGIIRSPAPYSPLAHPERAKDRRDWVLRRMLEVGRVDRERIEQALARPLGTAPAAVTYRRAAHFADAMAEEAERRYGLEELADAGFTLFATLSWSDQQAAQAAAAEGLAALETSYEKGNKAAKGPLQAALVSLDPGSGGILAYVGGRDYVRSQFDRAGRAERQAGSAFKPVVYAAAFESGRATPASFLEDSPLTVRLASGSWSPRNDDGSFHDWVTVRTALERSYNPATARLALQVGIDKVVALAAAMGVGGDLQPNPSVALGAIEVTPLELATVYATLAAGGVRPPVHGLLAVFDRYGKPVTAAPLPERERVLTPQTAYLVTSVLQGVVDRGTGRGVRSWGVRGELAGKTGTTNRRRDAWFVGYSPQRTTAVWVGYDDNAPTRLSGARGAVPVWARFALAVAPSGGYPAFEQPPGITTAVIDPTTGLLATEYCPYVLTEVFRQGNVPGETCDHHRSWYDQFTFWDEDTGERIDPGVYVHDAGGEMEEAGEVRGEERRERRHPIRRWLRKVFGGNGDEGEGDGGGEDGERRESEEPPRPDGD